MERLLDGFYYCGNNITILHRLGNEKIVVDFLYNMKNYSINIPIVDNFPDEYLFAISTKTLWFVYIANYLPTGKFPPQLSTKKDKEL